VGGSLSHIIVGDQCMNREKHACSHLDCPLIPCAESPPDAAVVAASVQQNNGPPIVSVANNPPKHLHQGVKEVEYVACTSLTQLMSTCLIDSVEGCVCVPGASCYGRVRVLHVRT
jgi:hypothetical protein